MRDDDDEPDTQRVERPPAALESATDAVDRALRHETGRETNLTVRPVLVDAALPHDTNRNPPSPAAPSVTRESVSGGPEGADVDERDDGDARADDDVDGVVGPYESPRLSAQLVAALVDNTGDSNGDDGDGDDADADVAVDSARIAAQFHAALVENTGADDATGDHVVTAEEPTVVESAGPQDAVGAVGGAGGAVAGGGGGAGTRVTDEGSGGRARVTSVGSGGGAAASMLPEQEPGAATMSQLEDPTSLDETKRCFTRGLNPRAALAWVRQVHGEAAVWKLVDQLDDDDDNALGGGRVGATTWVPFLAHARLLQQLDRTFGKGDLSLLREVGRFMCARDFPLVARPLLRLASPGFFLDKAMKLWRLYHSHGRWEIERWAGEARASLVGHSEHHVAFCATFAGWCEGALALTGAREVNGAEVRCAAKGAPCCSFVMTWQEGRQPPRERVPRPPT